jgi:microcystin-dependent protein
MPDTTTTNLLLIDQATGNNYNSWGDIADANWTKLDNAYGARTALTLSSTNVTLTATEERVNAIHCTGTLTGNVDIIFTGKGGRWIVKNSCSGNFTVTLKVAAQTGVTISRGTTIQVYFNGTDIAYAGPIGHTVGMYQPFAGSTAPTGWVRSNGRTIGSATSGGTERANADCEELFALLWDTYSNTVLVIQDSAGTPTTRGASASADFAANKRMPLPDLRGRTLVGVDDMGNSAAGRITTNTYTSVTTLGLTGGAETIVLTTAQLPAHAHTITHDHTFSGTTGTESQSHTHSGTTSTDGAHTHDFTYDTALIAANNVTTPVSAIQTSGGATTVTTQSGGSHSHTMTTGAASVTHTHAYSGTTSGSSSANSGNAGSGDAHNNMPPSLLCTWLIKL